MSVFAEFVLPVTAFPPGGRLETSTDVTVELERVVPTGSVTHYLWVVGDDYEHVVENLLADPSVESLNVLEELGERVLVGVHWEDVKTPVFGLIEGNGAALVDATGTAEGWTATLRFPDEEGLSAFYEECRRRGIALELRGVNESGLGERGGGYGLTPAQRETVVAAFEAGYFDVPREATLAELADRLGISEQAVSERLRRGLGKFLTATLHGERAFGSTDAERDA